MAYVDWMIKGPKVASCNCSYGCPCEFNARPTNDVCEGLEAQRIDQGYFGDVRLDGIVFAASDGLGAVAGAMTLRERGLDVRAVSGALTLSPLARAEAAERLQTKTVVVEGICRYLIQRHRLVRLEGKYLIHRAVMDEMARQVREWEVEDFAVGDFKDRFGFTRKIAIPALEWLDSERVTVRHGNRRKIVRRKG